MTDEAMSPLRRPMIEDMTICKFAPKTQHDQRATGQGLRCVPWSIPRHGELRGRAPLSAASDEERRRRAILATGAVGIIAGIEMLARRCWARRLSLVFGGLLILSCAFSFLMVPIIASIGTYDLGSLSAYDLTRLIIFIVAYVALPVSYGHLLCIVFQTRKWKAAFATDSTG
jgi:hypothetical protein